MLSFINLPLLPRCLRPSPPPSPSSTMPFLHTLLVYEPPPVLSELSFALCPRLRVFLFHEFFLRRFVSRKGRQTDVLNHFACLNQNSHGCTFQINQRLFNADPFQPLSGKISSLSLCRSISYYILTQTIEMQYHPYNDARRPDSLMSLSLPPPLAQLNCCVVAFVISLVSSVLSP